MEPQRKKPILKDNHVGVEAMLSAPFSSWQILNTCSRKKTRKKKKWMTKLYTINARVCLCMWNKNEFVLSRINSSFNLGVAKQLQPNQTKQVRNDIKWNKWQMTHHYYYYLLCYNWSCWMNGLTIIIIWLV